MLTENSSNIFLRAALAVLEECEEDLMKLDDFEDLITYLKVCACSAKVLWDVRGPFPDVTRCNGLGGDHSSDFELVSAE